MNSVTVREATPADKEAVLNLHDNVYDGLDYIAEYYDEFISCPLTTPYVALIDNKIVGFVATFIVDDGKTVVTRAARLAPSVTGKGLYKQLDTFVLRASGVSRHSFTTSNINPAVKTESFRAVNKLVSTMSLTRFLFDARCLQIHKDTTTESLHCPTDEDLKRFFTEPTIRHYLFPRERIIVDWVPLRLIGANIPLLQWSGQRTKAFSDVSVKSDGQVGGLLSFSTTIPVKSPPFACHLYIYGNNTTTLKHHIISQIRHLREATDGVTCLLVIVEPEFNMDEFENIFKEYGIKKDQWRYSQNTDIIISQIFLFEKEL